MSGKREKVTVKILHIDRTVAHRLCGIDQDRDFERVRRIDNFFNGIDCPEGIGNVNDRDKFNLRGEKLFKLFPDDLTFFVYGNDLKDTTLLFAENLPRDN